MSKQAESSGLAEPFKGVTADGSIRPRPLRRALDRRLTGPVRTAADTFLRSLSEPQRQKTMFAVDDSEWRKWMNQHFYTRQGAELQ